MFGKLGALFGAFVYGGSYHLRGGAGGGVAVLWPLIFFAQLTVHCKAAAIKRQEHELSLAPQPAAVAEARVLQ